MNMKHISKLVFLALLLIGYTACNKVSDLPHYQNGIASVLSASTASVAPAAADSNKVALALNWTYPNYAVSDPNSVKYIIEIDSTGKNFATEYTKIVNGSLTTSFTGKEINNILLAKGYAFNVPATMDVRITSSYPNNNERITSNVLKINMTPYKVPPKVALPASGKLFLVGSATQGGWNNPVPVPAQEFARLDETTFGGVFQLNGGQEYLMLPVNGDWGHKYSVADKSVVGLNQGGNFGYDLSDNFPGPATSGLYKIVVDFQAGKFTVTPYTGNLPDNLYIVGDATQGGWNNPVPVPSQQFARLNSSQFEITLPLTGGKQYLLLPQNGDWSHKYAVQDNSVTGLAQGGEFGYDFPSNFPGPATDGTYKIEVNFVTNTFRVTKQ
jgi:hypothetical protein